MQIIPCGHIFNPTSLLQWFETSGRCPLCRVDIRENNEHISINNRYRHSYSSYQVPINRLSQIITTDIIDQINNQIILVMLLLNTLY